MSLPNCPPWCELAPGHPPVTLFVGDDGIRLHTRQIGAVPATDVRVCIDQTDDAAPNITAYGHCEELDATAVRQLAALLLDGADVLDATEEHAG